MTTSLFDKGLEVRKAVLGAEYVETSIKNADDFNRPLQDLVTEYCWGAVWTREGLSRKTRSMLNLAMLSVLNRPHELELHLRGALRNGCTKEEIREVLLQVAIYAGVPGGSRCLPHCAKGLRRGRGQAEIMTIVGQHIGFIGLGNMGAPMAGRLLDAGHTLTVFDTRRSCAAAICSQRSASGRLSRCARVRSGDGARRACPRRIS